ncbi:hypothetical protein GW915_11310 [bacterium]|nr:hypothetical protein [bacterium]
MEQIGAVRFSGSLEDAFSVASATGIGSRLFMRVAEFECTGKFEFEKGMAQIDWQQFLTANSTFRISVHGLIEGKGLKRSFAPLLAKDIICDYFREKTEGTRPSVDTKDPQVHIELYYSAKAVTVSIELSRSPIHKRGYRTDGGKAPLRESLAYAFYRFVEPKEETIIDPFCGSGTILIETARGLKGDILSKPDFDRDRPNNDFWNKVSPALKKTSAPKITKAPKLPKLRGFDISEKQIESAQGNLSRSQTSNEIEISKMDACNPPQDLYKNSLIMCNPPHGDRVFSLDKAANLIGNFARKVKFDHSPCRMALILPDDGLAKNVGFAPSKKLRIGAGEKTYLFLIYEIYAGSKKRTKD